MFIAGNTELAHRSNRTPVVTKRHLEPQMVVDVNAMLGEPETEEPDVIEIEEPSQPSTSKGRNDTHRGIRQCLHIAIQLIKICVNDRYIRSEYDD